MIYKLLNYIHCCFFLWFTRNLNYIRSWIHSICFSCIFSLNNYITERHLTLKIYVLFYIIWNFELCLFGFCHHVWGIIDRNGHLLNWRIRNKSCLFYNVLIVLNACIRQTQALWIHYFSWKININLLLLFFTRARN